MSAVRPITACVNFIGERGTGLGTRCLRGCGAGRQGGRDAGRQGSGTVDWGSLSGASETGCVHCGGVRTTAGFRPWSKWSSVATAQSVRESMHVSGVCARMSLKQVCMVVPGWAFACRGSRVGRVGRPVLRERARIARQWATGVLGGADGDRDLRQSLGGRPEKGRAERTSCGACVHVCVSPAISRANPYLR